ncbi:MAG: helix-turn-helix transcriptional regulator [Oscillospiraceae bacterium]|nr:helix-turn-helix transcriptional regulator [Oscillospiraceae bacterium]
MTFSYNRLWKLLIDRKMKKKDLCQLADISHVVLTRMANGGSITTDSLLKICVALSCQLDDIMELVEDDSVVQGGNE